MPNYSLELELYSVLNASTSDFEIWADGVQLGGGYTINSSATSIIIPTISYGGSLPTSLEFRFNDLASGSVDQIEVRSVKINDMYVNTINYLSSDVLNDGGSATVNIANADFIFDSSDPASSEFTIGATRTMTAGNDKLRAWSGSTDEIFDALAGNDVIWLGSGNDKVSGSAGNDTIRGGAGNDLISGGADHDRLWGGAGADKLYGGTGNDRIYGDAGDDEIHGGDGNDVLNGHGDDDIITGGLGADIIHGGDGNDDLWGEAGADRISAGSGIDTVDGGAGADILYGGAGADVIHGGDDNDVIVGDEGDDILHGDDGDDIIYGRDDNDTIFGGDGDDEVYGGGGDDTIDGGADDDVLVGSDVQLIDTTTYVSYGGSQDVGGTVTQFTGGMTLDGNLWKKVQVDYTVTANTIIEFDFKSTLEAEVSGIGFDNDDGIDANATFEIYGTQTWGRQNFANYDGSGDWTHYKIDVGSYYTGTFSHLFFTNDDDDNSPATGTDGNSSWANIIIYESTLAADTDVIDGGTGNDHILGNNGDDTLSGGDGLDVISGNDGDDTLNGNNQNDILHGGAGADTLDGGANNDEIYGDAGDDVIIMDLGNDTINGGAGTDVIDASAYGAYVTIDLSDLAVQSTRMGNDIISNVENLIGTGFNDTLGGDAGANTINGGAGNDRIYGNGGADFLYGEAGNDDFWISGTDAYNDTYDGGADYDEMQFSADAYFNSSVVFVDIERIDMNGHDAIAELNDGFDFTGMIVTARGDMLGQGGNETITGSDSTDYIYGLAGTDTLSGGIGSDRLYGGADNDTLNGGVGNDRLYGEAGADIINGDAGDDDIYFGGTEAAGDTIDGGADNDDLVLTSNAFLDFTTSFTNMERVIFGGFTITANVGTGFDLSGMTRSGASNLYGQGGSETITGTESSDVFYGLAGADILNGGGGNDDFYISGTDSLGDQYDGGAGGTDEIHLQADVYFNSANTFTAVERVVFNGFTIFADVGTSFDLTGMTRTGASTLSGQGGNETITGTNSADIIYGLAGDDVLSGGSGGDTIYGGDDDDTINGGASADFIYGGAGADAMFGDDGNDNFYISGTDATGDTFDGGAGTDYVRLEADVTFDSTTTFTSINAIINANAHDIYLVSGTTIDFSGVNRSGSQGYVYGAAGVETITGFSNADYIYGLGGADILSGGGGNDRFRVSGTDSLGDQYDGGAGTDYVELYGDATFDGTNVFTSIETFIMAGFNVDIASGATVDFTGITRSGAGNIEGAAGNETIYGMTNVDYMYGFAGDDTLYGNAGNDFIYGGNDDDTIYGGDGRDELYGEAGADTFVLENATAFNDIERLRDFSTVDNDALDLTDLLSGYTFGVDDLTQFVLIVDAGANSTVSVDVTGSGTFTATERVATLYGSTGLTDEVALETSGHLITH